MTTQTERLMALADAYGLAKTKEQHALDFCSTQEFEDCIQRRIAARDALLAALQEQAREGEAVAWIEQLKQLVMDWQYDKDCPAKVMAALNRLSGHAAPLQAREGEAVAPVVPLSAMRCIAVEAIRSITGCPDIRGNDKYLSDEIEAVAKACSESVRAIDPWPERVEKDAESVHVAAPQPAQPEQVDWKDQYEKQKRRAEMWIAKYEKDIGQLEKVYPVAQPEQGEPDPQLCKFYDVDTYPELVSSMLHHIKKLQAKLPPSRDTQPGRVREG